MVHIYGIAHEEELWDSFKADMYGTDSDAWLYGGSISEDHPADLGYFVGYRISQGLLRKTQRFSASVTGYHRSHRLSLFLEKSGYGTF